MDELIKYSTGSNKEKSNWAHPQVAMNIAQWMSPVFDVMVSSWVYEVMMTGKVDISNTKSYRELQSENKESRFLKGTKSIFPDSGKRRLDILKIKYLVYFIF